MVCLNLNFPQVMSFMGTFANPGLGRSNGEGFGCQPGILGRLGSQITHLLGDLSHIHNDLARLHGGMGGCGLPSPGCFGMGPFGQNSGWPSMGGGFDGFGCPSQQSPWTVTNKGDGREHIDLGKYTLDLNESGSQWILTNKLTGAKTDISGDPHVTDNGGTNRWDFKNNTTFQLDDGTQITVHTVPAGNGTTFSSVLDISKGGHGMRVSGLAEGNRDGRLRVTDGLNGYALAARNLGTQVLFENGQGWQTFDGFYVNAAVAARENL
jgi:hypothetical protein